MKQLLIPCIAGALAGKMVVDLFAGFGGASLGIEIGTGRSPDVAVNHCRHKIAIHALNHPATVHLCDDVRLLKPKEITKGWQVGLLWLSPDCRHFSRAKGTAPVSDSVRSLAWEAVAWMDEVRPEVIALENVPEFVTWGPLDAHGQPDPVRQGQTFLEWVQAYRDRGYVCDWRVLCAADYGAPTTRRRLFFVAWLKPEPIPWPEPTHAAPGSANAARLLPWRSAGECIDWSIDCPSIRTRKRPLAEATCRRVAKGALRYVINAAEPYLVHCAHGDHPSRPGGRINDLAKPLGVITKTNNHALVAPYVARIGQTGGNGSYSQEVTNPLSTITSKAEHLMVGATLAAMRGGEASHEHGEDLARPLRTVSAKGTHHALVAASLVRNFTGMDGGDLRKPVPTITAKDHHSLLAVHLTKFRQNSVGTSLHDPVHTVTSGAGSKRPAGAAHAMGLVGAHLVQTGYGERKGQAARAMSLADPIGTVVAGGAKHAVSAAYLSHFYGSGCTEQTPGDPLHTVTTRARHAVVTADLGSDLAGAIWTARFLRRYADNVPVTWLRIGGRLRPVVMLTIKGVSYLLVDLGLRMLVPRELARAQGFPDDYVLEGTKAQQIAGIGNSVCPPVAAAIVRTLFPPKEAAKRRRKAA